MDLCLIYFSSSVKPFQEADLVSLLQQSRKHNSEVGITGVLLYVRGRILQVLEGDKQAVESLYKRIEEDIRHTNVSLALSRPITQRLFAKWTMGYETLTHHQFEAIRAMLKSSGRIDEPVSTLYEHPVVRMLRVFYNANLLN